MSAWVAFMVNQLTKIAQSDSHSQDKKYAGPGENIQAFDLGEKRMQDLFRRVDAFSNTFLSEAGLGKQLSLAGRQLTRSKRNEDVYARLKNLALSSYQRMMELEREVWRGRGVEGLYHTKNAIMVAHFLENGHNLLDLAEAVGEDQLKQKAEHKVLVVGKN
jgi:hypothetical protein